MSTFPSVNIDESKKNQKWYQEYIDAVINYHIQRTARKARIEENYRSYNGIVRKAIKKIFTEKYEGTSSVPFKSFKLGRAKIAILKGEFIDIDLQTDVHVVNPEAINLKAKKSRLMKGASILKEDLDGLKAMGINVLGGADIPAKDDPDYEQKVNPKLDVEKSMQAIIDKKIIDLDLKLTFLLNFVDLILNAECHGYVFKNKHGIDDYIAIAPEDAIFQESSNDPKCVKSPFHGHIEYMFPEDIIATYPNMDEKTKKKIRELEDTIDLTDHNIHYKHIAGKKAYAVYNVEWSAPEKVVRKTSSTKKSEVPYYLSIDPEQYEKDYDKIKKDVDSGKYEINVKYKESIYGGTRVGQDIYFNIGKKNNTMYTTNALGKYVQMSNYVHILYDSVNGERLSIHELIENVSDFYDVVMYKIASEIHKLKGKVYVYDEAYKPKKSSMKNVFYDIEEHGVIRINSAADGNYSERDLANAANLIKDLDLGVSQSFNHLLTLKRDLELTVDRLTGINEAREGATKATMSATGAVQNLEASRSITRDLFFFMETFVSDVTTKIAEKTKLNDAYLDSLENTAFGAGMRSFLRISKDIPFNNYLVMLTSGKEDRELKERVRQYFPIELNSQSLRTLDVIKFEREKNISMAIQHLVEGWDAVNEIQKQQMESNEKINEKKLKEQHQMAIEDREDWQAHELEKVVLSTKAKMMTDTNKTQSESLIK